ncbi:MAG: hypothetical protein LUF00_02410 [Lachnospiraceae bacterium]|nr:hypothetical protein [Lachnospiraceae bacterium]
MKIKTGDLIVCIENQFPETAQRCRDYVTDGSAEPDFTVRVTPEERTRCKEWFLREENMVISDGLAEYDWMKHKVHALLPEHGAFWLHACVVEMEGVGYAFTAPAGYGKTTHASLWLREFGDRVRVINGDNPIIRRKNGIFYAYGTPWGGKEGWSVNTGVPLKAVCYLYHDEKNALKRLEPLEAYYRLMEFSRMYQTPDNTGKMLALYEELVEEVPFYQMNCTMEPEAAHVSYEGMRGNVLN